MLLTVWSVNVSNCVVVVLFVCSGLLVAFPLQHVCIALEFGRRRAPFRLFDLLVSNDQHGGEQPGPGVSVAVVDDARHVRRRAQEKT